MFRFTIRDVLWLTVVVAMGCVIVAQRAKLSAMHSEIGHQFERLSYAHSNLKMIAAEWKKDNPDRVEIADDWITVNGNDARWSFGLPLRPK
jgi:hypothetical protein